MDQTLSSEDKLAIIKQVEKICISAECKSKRLLCRFISYIVTESLAGRATKLKEYNIGVDVFNRGEDFDPGQDALVRIHAGRLRRMLNLYYLESGKNDTILIEIPKGGYIPYFREKLQITEPNKTKIQYAEGCEKPLNPIVGIFPLKNFSDYSQDNYFAVGLAEEISLELTRFDGLIIFNCIPYAYSNLNDDDKLIYIKEKKIRFVLDGSIHHHDKKIKILVKLTDQYTGEQIWAESYNRNLSNNSLFDLEESIAIEISSVLGGKNGIIIRHLLKDTELQKNALPDT